MKHIAIISSSVRTGRLSHRVALFLKNYLESERSVTAEILDLAEYDFPLFHERYAFLSEKPEALVDFTGRFVKADGLIIVSPVYNASYPAALKNVVDLYYKEWIHKPVGIVSVTSGAVPGIATVQHVQTLLLKMGAWVAPSLYTVINTAAEYDEDGTPRQPEQAVALAKTMVNDLLALTEKFTGK